MRVQPVLLAAGLIISANGVRANVITLTVGPNGQYKSIGAATAAADLDPNLNNNYDIQVAPGTYTNDFSNVTRPMTIEVAPNSPGQVVLSATEPLPNEKGIIVTTSSLTVKGLTFEGAEIDNSLGGNGAGIRDQSTTATSLIIENSIFNGNQEGILTGGSNFAETVQILNSQFTGNGNPSGGGQEHALYIGDALSLLVNNSLFCGTLLGHDIKSRAKSTTVENSQIYVGAADSAVHGCNAGSTSLGIDAPNGGQVVLTGDQIFQGDDNQNGAMVSYGEEGLNLAFVNSFLVSDSSFDNQGIRNSTGIQELMNGTAACLVPVLLANDSFQDVNKQVNPAGCSTVPARSSVPTVPEPHSLWLLLTALGCCAAFFARAGPQLIPRALAVSGAVGFRYMTNWNRRGQPVARRGWGPSYEPNWHGRLTRRGPQQHCVMATANSDTGSPSLR